MAQLTLEHLKGNTYLIPSPTNIGVYVEDEQAILIDSGNDKEAGRQILRLLNERGWQLKLIVNTHSNADHSGGNAFLQEKTNCGIAATRLEAAFIQDPLLETAFLYGAFPFRDLQNKFLMAKPSKVTSLVTAPGEVPDTGLQAIPLPGHFFEMIGVKTPDNILFIADSLFSEEIINKYHLFFMLDIKAQFTTFEKLRTYEAELYVPSHGQPVKQLERLIAVNRAELAEISGRIENICKDPVTADLVLQEICTIYGIVLNATQYVLLSSTIRSYLAYLYGEGRLECYFEEGKMLWRQVMGSNNI